MTFARELSQIAAAVTVDTDKNVSIPKNLSFTGTGNRIRGDFSNGTVANRTSFQTSTTNGATLIQTLPNGTSSASGFDAWNNSDPTNAGFGRLIVTSTEFSIRSQAIGTGTLLPLTMYTGGSERLRIDTSGNCGIGTSSPSTRLHVAGGSATELRITTSDSLASTGAALVRFGGSNSATSGYVGYGGTANDYYNWNALSGASIFGTGNTERMRIDSSGNLLVGDTSSPQASKVFFTQTAATGYTLGLNAVSNGGVYYLVNFFAANTQTGTISSNGTLTVYATTSDYRLKTVIAPVVDAGTRIDALQPIEYDWKAGGRTRGFLAHQFAEVYPNSVSGEKDAVDEEGKEVYQAMQASTPEVMADLIAEIQSLRKRVAQLESK
jgi:hypothetical protein